jgi:hypothetical protein
VIVKAEIEEPGAISQLPGEPKILPGRGRIAGRVVVDENKGGGPCPKRRAEDFPWVYEGSRLGARRDQCVHQVVVLGVQEDGPEVLLVIVGAPEKIASEQGDRLG